jgi:hypothetical protein
MALVLWIWATKTIVIEKMVGIGFAVLKKVG